MQREKSKRFNSLLKSFETEQLGTFQLKPVWASYSAELSQLLVS
jgi:hypothetical protein